MKKETKFIQSVLRVALATLLLLLVPLVAMQFTDEVNWGAGDFIVMGTLLFSIGFLYVLAVRFATNMVHRIAIGFALGSTFLMIWANLAVGLIGSGPHWGNLMYMGVLAVGIIGTIFSRFTAGGMARAMYGMALALVVVAAVALLAGMHQYPSSSVTEILGVNGFFAMLFAVAGLLFRHVALEQQTEKA
jgi:hypothetical protein